MTTDSLELDHQLRDEAGANPAVLRRIFDGEVRGMQIGVDSFIAMKDAGPGRVRPGAGRNANIVEEIELADPVGRDQLYAAAHGG